MTKYASWSPRLRWEKLVATCIIILCKDAHSRILPALSDCCTAYKYSGMTPYSISFKNTSSLVKGAISHIFVTIIILKIIERFDYRKMSLIRKCKFLSFRIVLYLTDCCKHVQPLLMKFLRRICSGRISVIIWLLLLKNGGSIFQT